MIRNLFCERRTGRICARDDLAKMQGIAHQMAGIHHPIVEGNFELAVMDHRRNLSIYQDRAVINCADDNLVWLAGNKIV